MKIEVILFAGLREAAGNSVLVIEAPSGATIAELRELLCERLPEATGVLRAASFAINAQYAAENAVIPATSEIACIPPVSGG